jgi:hypothetical protein
VNVEGLRSEIEQRSELHGHQRFAAFLFGCREPNGGDPVVEAAGTAPGRACGPPDDVRAARGPDARAPDVEGSLNAPRRTRSVQALGDLWNKISLGLVVSLICGWDES